MTKFQLTDFVIAAGLFLFMAWLPFVAMANRVANLGSGGGAWEQIVGLGDTTNGITGSLTTNVRRAVNFTAANSGTVTSVELRWRSVGAITGLTFDLQLRAAGASPGAVLTNGSIQIDGSAIPSVYGQDEYFYSTGPTLTASTEYWFEVHSDQVDASNHVQWRYGSTGTANMMTSTETESWSSVDTSMTMYLVINGTP